MIGELRLRNRSQRTIDSYVGAVYRLAKHYNQSPELLGLEQVRGFLIHLAVDRGLSPSTVNVAFNAIVFLYRDVLGRPLELAGIQRPRRRGKLPKAYARSEILRLLEAARAGAPMARLFLLAVYSAGLRLSEACALRWAHVQFERGMLRVDSGKGGKDRCLPLSPVLAGEMLPWRGGAAPDAPVFPSGHGDRSSPICGATGRRHYNLAVRRAGLARLGGIHCLRHSYATHQLERGVDVNTLRELMGHSSLKTTMIYLRVAKRRPMEVGTPLEDLYPNSGDEGGNP